MNIRTILYGYQYQSGELVPQPEEAKIVNRVFAMYLEGQPYQRIADTFNREKVPFNHDGADWNKNKVKRLLENPRYAGDGKYPPIIDSQLFQTVQARIQEKNAHLRQIRPVQRLRDRLWCAECGKKLGVTFKSENGQDLLHLLCRTCGTEQDIPDRDLLEQIVREAAPDSRQASGGTAYTPSAEVLRLANAINRGLEKPENPEEVLALILQGVSARYDCWTGGETAEPPPAWSGRKNIILRVSRIDIWKDGSTAVTFRTEQDG